MYLTSHTVTINNAGVLNTVSADQVTIVPTKRDLVITDASSEYSSDSEGLEAISNLVE